MSVSTPCSTVGYYRQSPIARSVDERPSRLPVKYPVVPQLQVQEDRKTMRSMHPVTAATLTRDDENLLQPNCMIGSADIKSKKQKIILRKA